MLHLQDLARLQALGWLGQTEPIAVFHRLQHQELHRAAAGPAGLKARLQHPGVVDHQQVTRFQKLLQLPDRLVAAALRAFKRQQPSRVAGLHGALGDERLREIEDVARKQLIVADQKARLSGLVSISWARSFRKAAASAP
jgi:hypothetical protein